MNRARTFAAVVALAIAGSVSACPFCTSQGQTLSADAAQAGLILYGTVKNPRPDPAGLGQGTTDLDIERVIKKNPILGDRKVLTLQRYVPSPDGKPQKYLVFCDVYKGEIDAYRGLQVKADSPLADYIAGALAVRDKPAAERLRFFFDYLAVSDIDVSNDAYTEFGNVDYVQFRPVAEKLPADVVAKWLKSADTPASRYGLYGSMLGHCGNAEHAELLRQLLENPRQRLSSGLDGLLAGYVMIQPKQGWDYLRGLLGDAKKDFLLRYAALRATRFLHDFRPDKLPPADAVGGVELLLDQKDVADLAVEDLRKWKHWESADRILGLWGKEGYTVPIVKRSIMRYALSCPAEKSAKAAAFVLAEKKRDAAWVDDVEDLLRIENKPAAPTPPPAATPRGR